MSLFVNFKNKVAVTDEQGNTIFIKEKMGYGSKQRVMGAMAKQITSSKDGQNYDVTADFGLYNILLLQENILDWFGPDFIDEETGKPKPVSKAAIEELDPDSELLDRVLTEIGKRNNKKKDVNTIPNSVESGSLELTEA